MIYMLIVDDLSAKFTTKINAYYQKLNQNCPIKTKEFCLSQILLLFTIIGQLKKQLTSQQLRNLVFLDRKNLFTKPQEKPLLMLTV